MRDDEYVVDAPTPEEVEFKILMSDEEAGEEGPEDEEQPARIPSKLERLVSSRKFWAALVGLGFVVVKGYHPEFPLEEEQVTKLVYVLVAYILGVALEDGLTARALNA